MQKQRYTWKEIVQESLWITIAWEWLQKLLGRAVDSVLWVTMVFAGYQLIPGAPQPWTAVSIFMFVSQFVALDIGGLGLNQLARQQGKGQWSYARVVAYCLIGITLITITYSGIEHAVPHLDAQVTTWMEVILVVARSVMTVLYGQAIHTLKAVEHEKQNKVAELEQEVSNLTVQLENEQRVVSSLRVQLNNTVSSAMAEVDSEVSSLRVQLDSVTAEVDSERQKVSSLMAEMDRERVSSVQLNNKKVSSLMAEVDTLRVQLDTKENQLTSLKETMASGMKWHESNAETLVSSVQSQLDSERERVSSLQRELSSAIAELDSERKKVSSVQLTVSSVQLQMDREVSRLKAELDSERKKVSSATAEVDTLRIQLDMEKKEVESLRVQRERKGVDGGKDEVDTKVIQLDTSRPRKNGQDDNAIGEQIRALLTAEPGLSGRAIAARVGCSPTTASKWKELIEKERKEA